MHAKTTAIVGLAFAFLTAGLAQAGGPATPAQKFKHADHNKDGKITPKEMHKEKQWEHKQKSRVDKPWEVKADKNKDGVVQPIEAHKATVGAYLDKKSDVNRPWEAKADKDGNGKVDAVELRAYHLVVLDKNSDGKVDAFERHEYWVQRKSKVNTEVEKQFDIDGDGWINGEEAKALLKAKLLVINTHGKAKVDTALEADYDANGDGLITPDEAQAVKDALGI